MNFEEFALWLFPDNKDRNGELFKIFLTIIGGSGVLYSLYLSYKRMVATNLGLQLQAKAINKQSEQLELSRDGQIDERFKNAVEHLGDEKEPIILGGIVELHQIAKENKEKYASVVFNILTSYLRTHLKVKNKRDDNFSTTIPQTIIDFLFKNEGKNLYNNNKANLSFCNLISIDISEADLSGADLSFCLMPYEISNTKFDFSKFGKTNFTISKLNNVSFRNSDFHDCIFNMCEIKATNFSNSNMLKINFVNTKLFQVVFEKVEFYELKFLLCNIDNIQLTNSRLLNNCFSGSNFLNSKILSNEITNTNFIAIGFKSTIFNSEFFQCNFIGVHKNYSFEYIQIDDIKNNIDKEIDESGIIMLESNSFLNCKWEKLTLDKFNHIKEEIDLIFKKLKEKNNTK